MPLDIEQESEDLLRTALEKLRSRMSDRGAYELGGNYDALDRALSSGVEGGGNYRKALETAKEIAPTLLDNVLGNEAPILDRMNLAGGGSGSVSSPYSGPVYNDGALGQLNLQTHQFQPALMAGAESSGLPPGYSSSRFMAPKAPGQPFFYAGDALSDDALAATPPMGQLGPSTNPGFFYAGSAQPLAETLEQSPGPDMRNQGSVPGPWSQPNDPFSAPQPYDERGEAAARAAYGQSDLGQENYLRALPPGALAKDYPEEFGQRYPQQAQQQAMAQLKQAATVADLAKKIEPEKKELTDSQKNSILSAYRSIGTRAAGVKEDPDNPDLARTQKRVFREQALQMEETFPWLKGTNSTAAVTSGSGENAPASTGAVTSKSQFDALPSGATYRGKDGKLYRKP